MQTEAGDSGYTQHRRVLVTGGAGFIGSHLVDLLLDEGWLVTVLDNFDETYSVGQKRRNVQPHMKHANYRLIEADIRDHNALHNIGGEFDVLVHLAARAGVRPSIADPLGYHDVNVRGTQVMLDMALKWGVRQFVFASSSSVYGINPNVPWREDDPVLLPISPYAGTKVSGELLGHVYSHLYSIRFVALRFFTVYGPRQRPDLAIHKFAKLMQENEPIPFFGDGNTYRDYTHVSDVVAAIRAAMSYDRSKYEVINIGNDKIVSLSELVGNLEMALGVKAKLDRLPMPPGDVPRTWADLAKARRLLGYEPRMTLVEGLREFARWLNSASPS